MKDERYFHDKMDELTVIGQNNTPMQAVLKTIELFKTMYKDGHADGKEEGFGIGYQEGVNIKVDGNGN